MAEEKGLCLIGPLAAGEPSPLELEGQVTILANDGALSTPSPSAAVLSAGNGHVVGVLGCPQVSSGALGTGFLIQANGTPLAWIQREPLRMDGGNHMIFIINMANV